MGRLKIINPGKILALLVGGALFSVVVILAGGNHSVAAGDVPAVSGDAPLPDTVEPFLKDHLMILNQKSGEKLHFDVEMALTPHQQAYGLMNRTSIKKDTGMFFVYGYESKEVFWMKDTLIPLDILFVHADGRIHHIHHNARPQDLTSITSEEESKAVLELPAGTCDKYGLTEGDTILHAVFRNDKAQAGTGRP